MTPFLKVAGAILLVAVLTSLVLTQDTSRSPERRIDDLVNRFLEQHKIPGAVVAYGMPGHDPRLAAFGVADPATGRAMSVTDRFKLASLSKPVTATAILELMRSDPEVTASTTLASILPKVSRSVDPRMGQVTLEHLLQHRAGWTATQTFDPFFLSARDLEAQLQLHLNIGGDCGQLAEAMLRLPLQAEPGSKYAYSNLGYCWLGHVLEARTGLPLEQAVKRLVPETTGLSLDPSAVTVTHATTAVEAEFAALHPGIAAAAGGWIGTAGDYFTFAARPVDEPVFTPPPHAQGDQHYGLGWRIWQTPHGRILTHFGSMPGVYALVARGADGPIFVALFNGRPAADLPAFHQLFDTLLAEGLLRPAPI